MSSEYLERVEQINQGNYESENTSKDSSKFSEEQEKNPDDEDNLTPISDGIL